MKLARTDFLAMLFAQGKERAEPTSLEDLARDMETLAATVPPVEGVSVATHSLGGIEGLWFAPEHSSDEQRCILYIHGGGYGAGSPHTHQTLTALIAKNAGIPAWSIDYRLSTEAPFPAAIEDCLAAYMGLVDSGYDARQIAVVGDSAGGGAAVALGLMLADRGLPQPSCMVLFSPWADLTLSGPSHQKCIDRDPSISRGLLDLCRNAYVQPDEQESRYASPGLADLTGLPPLLIQVGSEELLLSDSVMLAANAGTARVEVNLQIWPQMGHVFQAYYPFVEGAEEALGAATDWLRRQTP